MANQPINQEKQSGAPESIVGPSVKIEGDLKSSGNLRIDGIVAGKVSTSQSLLVGETANISADISAENAMVSGTIQGNVKVLGALILGRTAKVSGDITCGSLQVENGAIFNGKCQMKGSGSFEPMPEKISVEKAEKK